MEQENEEKIAENHVEASAEAPSENKTPKSLKASATIVKKPLVNALKTKNARVGKKKAQCRAGKKKKQNLVDERKDSNGVVAECSKKQTSREENLKKNLSRQNSRKMIEQDQKNHEEIGGLDESDLKQRGEEKKSMPDKSLGNQKNKDKQRDTEKSQERGKNTGKEERKSVMDKSLRNQKNKDKQRGTEKNQVREKKKEKLGGLIFMCSKKTKPDCFHYRVMGVSAGKKDIVLGIKPGLKLFLYDFDLKLMYGIYKASSSGGMKLEPKAFGGAFPAQVRFNIHRDCIPIPEGVFKKAIKENYAEKHKFKIELTPKQVRKLSELFRPASVHSTALPVNTPLRKVKDREIFAGLREANRENFARDLYANTSSRGYNRLSLERDQYITHGKIGSFHKEEVPRDLYLTEKEYRSYGLQRERTNLTTNHIAAPLDPYQRSHERGQQHLLRHPDYVDTVPASREAVLADPLYLTEQQYQNYAGARHELPSKVSPVAVPITATATNLDPYLRDPYNTHYYGPSSMDAYLPPPRREEVMSGSYSVGSTYLAGTDPLRRGGKDPADRLYSTYGTKALPNYTRHYDTPKRELEAAPVSSRYSFAGPSLSYR